ncbi:MAG: hypothetical protein A3B90_01115 [Candidatus Magasanikbacteria bacterium RIFCSPHIGHO2_02_FULL_41_13]|uniref:Addiction module toxin RelE n=1 Tax=Candidatus Magasanikbacteria bacterium RIFCSPHIGHO2_02_FULL_41_13 TaxID=1798676 RepID=A0A1F6M4Y0_9BACT|nr:MAG: hypothetical protein A3B90_01115 [Candidatus Magasanikbacteria bacterium RIFCSPHIGHO2_02_FULL_41_13]
MQCTLRYTSHALKDLEQLDKKMTKRILDKLDWFVAQVQPLSFAKKLKNSDLGTYRFRVGDYRILFDIEENTSKVSILMILRIKHRKEAYGL